jgi:hypothetical protein
MSTRLRTTRRSLVRGILVGGAALLTACGAAGSPPKAPPNAPPEVPLGAGPNSLAAPAVPPSSGAAPAGAPKTAVARATLVATAPSTVKEASTLAPTATASPVPSATPLPPATATPTATPIPYDASRLKDVLGESVTSYAGSVPPRVHNVQLATRLINGAKVPPGGVFSFDDTVGDQTAAHGFQVAWGIVSGSQGPETVQADAGGICQVATTTFQAVYWAGLPIVRRFHHLYWIAHYGQPPYGQIGLDATVDFPPVDFQFRNTTSDWIRVEATYDATHVHVRLLGFDQGWKITSSKPVIDNLVKADRAVQRREDPTMAAGKELTIEAAEDGFDVTIERTVTKNGALVDRYVFTNHYEPAHNVVVVGTKGATPTATPAPATPTSAAGTPGPTSPAQPGGQIRVPALVGLPEAQARQLVATVGLQNSYTNYQGPGDVPQAALDQVPVGAVLSQIPPPGTAVAPGTTVYIAVRK